MKISKSAYDKYTTCPMIHKYHYKDRIRPDTIGSALIFGVLMDELLNELLVNRDYRPTISLKDHYESTSVIWDLKDYDSLLFNEDEKATLLSNAKDNGYSGNDIDQLIGDLFKIAGRNCAYYRNLSSNQRKVLSFACARSLEKKANIIFDTYIEEILPRIPLDVKVQKEIDIDGVINGVIDFITDDRIYDNKTSKNPYSSYQVNSGIQLPIYCYAEGMNKAAFVVMEKIIKHYKSKPPRAVITLMEFDINENFAKEAVETLKTVRQHILNGVYYKNLNACSQIYGRKCDYINYCRSGSMDGLTTDVKERK